MEHGLSESTRRLIYQQREVIKRHPESEIREIPADGDYDHRLVKESLVGAIVCTRKMAAEAATWLTEVRPPGVGDNTWTPDPDGDEVPCKDRPETHRHVVVLC